MWFAVLLGLYNDLLLGRYSWHFKLVRDDPGTRFEFLQLREQSLHQVGIKEHRDDVGAAQIQRENVFVLEPPSFQPGGKLSRLFS